MIWIDAALSIAHFLLVLVLVGALAGEAMILKLPMSAQSLRALIRTDMLYGISAGLLIAAGVGRVFFGLKDESYYLANHAFWAKMAVFAAIGAISAIPTIRILKWAKALRADAGFLPGETETRKLRGLAMAQLHLLTLVVIFAAIMARFG